MRGHTNAGCSSAIIGCSDKSRLFHGPSSFLASAAMDSVPGRHPPWHPWHLGTLGAFPRTLPFSESAQLRCDVHCKSTPPTSSRRTARLHAPRTHPLRPSLLLTLIPPWRVPGRSRGHHTRLTPWPPLAPIRPSPPSGEWVEKARWSRQVAAMGQKAVPRTTSSTRCSRSRSERTCQTSMAKRWVVPSPSPSTSPSASVLVSVPTPPHIPQDLPPTHTHSHTHHTTLAPRRKAKRHVCAANSCTVSAQALTCPESSENRPKPRLRNGRAI